MTRTFAEPARATFCPGADEVDPRRLADYLLAHHQDKAPELRTAFHPDRHPLVRAVLRWASDQGQAVLVGPVDGDFDIQLPQVHLNLDLPMLGEGYAPYGHLHLALHDLLHHYLGQVRVRPEDVQPERLAETRKRVHQAAMVGELVASYATCSRVLADYANWRATELGSGEPGQLGGFFSFAGSERAVVSGWRAFYLGGEDYARFLREEMREERVLALRRSGGFLVWPGLAHLAGATRPWLRDLLHRAEAKLAPRLAGALARLYWDRSVYSVADFQEGSRHLADRYTSAWHVAWQGDFDDGASFDVVLERCRAALRGLVQGDASFFEQAPNDLGPGGYRVNVRRQQVRLFARKLYELRHHLAQGAIWGGDEAARASWLAALDAAAATCRDLFAALARPGTDAGARYAELLALREALAARFRAGFGRFRLRRDGADFLANPNRFLFDPGVRDANVKARPSLWSRLAAVPGALRRALFGKPVSEVERGWTREAFDLLDVGACFDQVDLSPSVAGFARSLGDAGPRFARPSSWPPAAEPPPAARERARSRRTTALAGRGSARLAA